MTNVHELPAARPFALGRERRRADLVHQRRDDDQGHAPPTTGGDLCLIETTAPSGTGRRCTSTTTSTRRSTCSRASSRSSAAASATAPARARSRSCRAAIAHTFRVVGDRPARFLTIAVPGGLEGFFRDAGRPADGPGLPRGGAVDVGLLKQVSERYNAEIVGPPLAAAE